MEDQEKEEKRESEQTKLLLKKIQEYGFDDNHMSIIHQFERQPIKSHTDYCDSLKTGKFERTNENPSSSFKNLETLDTPTNGNVQLRLELVLAMCINFRGKTGKKPSKNEINNFCAIALLCVPMDSLLSEIIPPFIPVKRKKNKITFTDTLKKDDVI